MELLLVPVVMEAAMAVTSYRVKSGNKISAWVSEQNNLT